MKKKEKAFLEEYTRFLDTTGTHLSYSALSVYRNLSDELSEKERRFLTNHLGSCTSCSARLKEVEEVESSHVSVQRRLLEWTAAPAFRYSMAAVLVLGLAITIAFLMQNRSAVESPTHPLVGSQTLAARTADPQRLVPNELLENFISRQVRSAVQAEFINPKNGDTLSTPMTFSWSSPKGVHRFELILVDNKNAEVWREKTSDGKLLATKKLEAGLYYAKLEADGVLVQVRKFVVLDAMK